MFLGSQIPQAGVSPTSCGQAVGVAFFVVMMRQWEVRNLTILALGLAFLASPFAWLSLYLRQHRRACPVIRSIVVHLGNPRD